MPSYKSQTNPRRNYCVDSYCWLSITRLANHNLGFPRQANITAPRNFFNHKLCRVYSVYVSHVVWFPSASRVKSSISLVHFPDIKAVDEKNVYKSEENPRRRHICFPWEPKIVIGQPGYQKSTIRVNTVVSSGIRLAFIRRHRSFVCSLKQILLRNLPKCYRNLHDMSNLTLPLVATKLSGGWSQVQWVQASSRNKVRKSSVHGSVPKKHPPVWQVLYSQAW